MDKSAAPAAVELPARASLRSNATSLYVLQLANYLIPLITLPFLVRMLGVEAYGSLAIAHSIVFFMVLLVDSGFNNLAIRELSRADLDKRTVNEIYAANLWLRAIFALGCFALLVVVIAPLAHAELVPLLFASFLMVAGSLLFPTWLFQGLEVMHVTTICSVAGRLLATAAIFLLIRGPEDVLLAAIAQSSATALSGLLCSLFVIGRLKLNPFLPVRRILSISHAFLFKARSLWVSEFSTASMSNSPVFVLSLFVSSDIVGSYAAMDKIIRAAISVFQPLQKALFPKIAMAWRHDKGDQSIRDTWTLRLIVGALVAGVLLCVSAGLVLQILFGSEFGGDVRVLQLLSAWLLLVVVGVTVNQFWLLASGNNVLYSRVLIAGAITQLMLTLTGTAIYGIYGMAGALVAAEMLRLVYTKRALIRISNGVML